MRVTFHGGFGEKGRTCSVAEHGGFRVMLDCGVNTSDANSYYPDIASDELRRLDAMIISHAHEDHIAALGWCLRHGFAGRILMTRETWRDADDVLRAYATARDCRTALKQEIEFIAPGQDFHLGPFLVDTGRSGHIVGGIWIRLGAGGRQLLYCGDVVPDSPVFPMDALPQADTIMIDASYGVDRTPAVERHQEVIDFIRQRQGAVLPTPLMGRSLELLRLLPVLPVLADGMRKGLRIQTADVDWVEPTSLAQLNERLAAALDWSVSDPWPDAPILCHDGMGLAGPSETILERALRERQPTLLTGHLPDGSPGDIMLKSQAASWRRFPTHPTLDENLRLAQQSGADMVLPHSCAADILPGIATVIPGTRTDLRCGLTIEV
jgi:uncharacterized protein